MNTLLLFLAIAQAGSKPSKCIGLPELVGSCFEIHGRVSAYNGNPDVRIWPVGTKRLLGVRYSEDPIAPEKILKHVVYGLSDVYGDFLVCPFTKSEPGAMQMVCIESGRSLVVERWDGAERKSHVYKLKE